MGYTTCRGRLGWDTQHVGVDQGGIHNMEGWTRVGYTTCRGGLGWDTQHGGVD